MRRFKNILIGVDLANNDQLISDTLTSATNAAIDDGIWLAQQNDARLLFFHVLEIPDYARFVAEQNSDIEESLVRDCEERLTGLVQRAKMKNVAADYAIAFGRSWVEIIRYVLKEQCDLVIAGTRQRGTVSSVLFGSTGMKLLRKCPCPVWITKPRKRKQIASVLVADDLSPVSDLSLELGVSMADLQQAQLHVLHVLELGLGRREWDSYKIRERARAEATKKLDDHMARVVAANLTKPPRIDIVVDAVDTAIIRRIEQCEIDLLVMGTLARGGIAGLFMGNTAERLLPRISCSVLAVKPDDFICPIAVECNLQSEDSAICPDETKPHTSVER